MDTEARNRGLGFLCSCALTLSMSWFWQSWKTGWGSSLMRARLPSEAQAHYRPPSSLQSLMIMTGVEIALPAHGLVCERGERERRERQREERKEREERGKKEKGERKRRQEREIPSQRAGVHIFSLSRVPWL